ncbi:MAG TPA: M67 family metallopeptidase [Candidatus Saccharimonadales bacterium]|nr:M67 family metallopeptidase [Candidatus Saccharimonadales bacterium]
MDVASIVVEKWHISTLDNLVKESGPIESCAILLGRREESRFLLQEVVPTQNKESSIASFAIDEERLLEIYSMAEKKGLSVIGVFHSHPSGPIPSETDKVYMQINPVPWIIRSTTTNEMRCFVYGERKKDNTNGPIHEIIIQIKG